MPSEPPVTRMVWRAISSGHLHEEKSVGSVTHSTLDGKLVLATESEHFGNCISDDGADQYRYSQ